ncbi:MAG TPA: hypothetical protein QF753_09855 [Victivallales bacterium]|nr:hypothetical protein [Victivallales bacterium]
MKKIIIITLAVFIVIIIFLVILSSLILSHNIPSSGFKITNKSIAAMNSLNKKYQEESYYIYSKNTGYKLRRLSLSETEINAMFIMAIAGNQVSGALRNREKTIKLSRAVFENGIFTFDFYFELPIDTPFGSYVIFSSKAIPILKNNSIRVKFTSFYIGDISVPIFAVDYFMERADKNINNNSTIKQLVKSVKEIIIKKDRIIIYYYPKEVKKLLDQF